MTGLFLAALAVDVHLSDTYFVVPLPLLMVGGTLLAYLGDCISGGPRSPAHGSGGWGDSRRGSFFVGFQPGRFCRSHRGYLGMPRRYHAYRGVSSVQGAFDSRRLDSGCGFDHSLHLLLWSMRYGNALNQTRGTYVFLVAAKIETQRVERATRHLAGKVALETVTGADNR